MQHPLQTLTAEECWTFLRSRQVGRFVYADADGPMAVPVNFALAEQTIIFRTARESGAHRALMHPSAFQVDDLHPEQGRGLSVLVRGRTREVPHEQVPELFTHMEDFPRPLAEGIHNIWVALTPSQVTGRRLGSSFIAARC